jgi:Protein of unknown function (DUF2950)
MTREMMKMTMVPLAMLAIAATAGSYPALGQQSQPTYPSAALAGQALYQAVQHDDTQAIANILGGPTDLGYSRDDAQDKLDRQLFVQKYGEMHRVHHESDGSVTLYVGAENWPFPIPLVGKNGAWRFDSDAGVKEVLYRRVGENELTAIAICHDFVATAKHNGTGGNLPNPEDGPATRLVARAAGESGGGEPLLFHGYYFRELPVRGSRASALIAYPAEYRSSGVMTFVVTNNDVVYEKDLGAKTPALAKAMVGFHKDATWVASGE